jgi:hypothetical protein
MDASTVFPDQTAFPPMGSTILPSRVMTAAPAPPHDGVEELVEACINQTAEALILMCEVSQREVAHAMAAVRRARAQGRNLDLIEAIARQHRAEGVPFATTIEALGERLASTLNPSPRLIPFAGRLGVPHALYDSYESIRHLAKAMSVPVIYAESSDSIGVGSVNPIAATLLAARIQDLVARRSEVLPFLTIARLDYKSWTLLTHRHFKS